MGWRYRSSIRIIPGIRVNLSKSGASLSVGRRGATVNLGRRGIRGTVGLPGTGISYSESASWHARDGQGSHLEPPASQRPNGRNGALGAILVLVALGLVLAVVVIFAL